MQLWMNMFTLMSNETKRKKYNSLNDILRISTLYVVCNIRKQIIGNNIEVGHVVRINII